MRYGRRALAPPRRHGVTWSRLGATTIGMGNPEGAKNIHARSLAVGYGAAIRDAGNYIMAHLPIVMGLAITENWSRAGGTETWPAGMRLSSCSASANCGLGKRV